MPLEPERALQLLREGNNRFSSGYPMKRYGAAERAAVVDGQSPWAVVVGCSDSRVPVEHVFDAGVGELFVVRTAGNVVGKIGFASIRFAVEMLGARAVVILGHEDCGAIKAALTTDPPNWLEPVTDAIHADRDAASTQDAVQSHITATVTDLRQRLQSAGIDPLPMIIGGVYPLGTGKVQWLEDRA